MGEMGEEMGGEGFSLNIPKNKQLAILAVFLIIVGAVYFSGVWKIPLETPTPKTEMLIIGAPSQALVTILDQDNSLVYYKIQDATQFETTPGQQLEQYDIVLLDQHLADSAFGQSVSRQFGEAIENFVRTGGKLIVVLDSGIYRSGPEGSVAADVIGWKSNFGTIMPVECDIGQGEKPTCETVVSLQGRIKRQDISHKIMIGVENAPASPSLPPYSLKTFDVKPIGSTVAIIEDEGSSKSFPAIMEKKTLLGKTIYFNYDPALTPGIVQNTLEYLR
ncbi:MAG: hypothetical protein CL943_03940 [Candidatus Diapherotrites archaeon]|uniref:DUF4350 domain-containing protein n=1 Tax=Candidatus Iainarchaeum sp. TaxID=3101447 RepID=A0A2D6M1X2_9ARCH|nr:hypothetical protein [Candidatus Diapherotrites archaeon]|tara:strand:- start:2215 stop:3042 length:828 start_codon:yes stop_codon:yes gene_type:complete